MRYETYLIKQYCTRITCTEERVMAPHGETSKGFLKQMMTQLIKNPPESQEMLALDNGS